MTKVAPPKISYLEDKRVQLLRIKLYRFPKRKHLFLNE